MYSYFAATLPYPAFDSPPPFTEEAFAVMCRQHLSASDFAAFEALRSGGGTKHPFVLAWRDFEAQLRNASAKIRAAKLGIESDKWRRPQRGWSVALETAAAAAFAETDPMRRDLALKKILWDAAEEIAGLDNFSAASIFARFIRLRILVERAHANADSGKSRLLKMAETENKSF